MYNREYTPENISALKENEIIVFGSRSSSAGLLPTGRKNLEGLFNDGPARLAFERFAANRGQGVGLKGQCYAIPIIQSDDAMQVVKYGHIPDAMEDHWFMYCDEDTIRYYRSWTGFCIYIAKYVEEGDKCIITELQVNRDPEQYRSQDNDHDVSLFMVLLTEEYGVNASQYWNKVF